LNAYLVARRFLTPPSFGQYGWYRGKSLEELASREPVYVGKQACDECHSDVIQTVAKFEHKTVSCESCHGVSKAHADNPDVPIAKLTDSDCMRCHQENPSRPAWLRQITLESHYTGHCVLCHVPHEPNEVP
jgi:ribosomal protein L37AE/L43A